MSAVKRKPATKPAQKPPPRAVAAKEVAPPLRLEYIDPADLDANEHNWRSHPESQLVALKDIVAAVGFAGALLYNERTKRLVDGHARKSLFAGQKVPVLVGNWSEEQERTILASLDPIAALATADSAKLAALLASVRTDSAALQAMFDGLRAEHAAAVVPGGGGDEFDSEAALPGDGKPTRTQAGDLWVIGGKHRLVVADCTDPASVTRLMDGRRARAVWTDPPYGVNHSGGTKDPREALYRSGDKLANDNLPPEQLRAMLFSALVAAQTEDGATAYLAAPQGPLIQTFMQSMNDAGYPYRGHVVWVKNKMVFGRSLYHYRHEPILYGWKAGAHFEDDDRTLDSVFAVDSLSANEDHPTQKPLGLLSPMLKHSSAPGDIVYDPFAGSGTTLIAAHRLGRVAHCMEIEPRYADVILARAEAESLTCEKAS